MRITLTGRRLALAAALVLGGVAAPLAYATISDTKKAVAKTAGTQARSLAPVSVASAGSTQAPAAVADNPYQVFQEGSIGFAGDACIDLPLPALQDFVLESVAFMPGAATGAVNSVELVVFVKSPTSGNGLFTIPLDALDSGTRAFNLVVRPDALAAAAPGDIYALQYCVSTGAAAVFGLWVTGQRLGSPTAAQVSSFDATSRKAGATLHWKTASETTILGFNVWRYRGTKGVKVNRTLVRAKRSGEPVGASYRYVDFVRGAKRGLTYRLQLVDLKGKRTWYAAFAIASK
jgi:hypothetical protein